MCFQSDAFTVFLGPNLYLHSVSFFVLSRFPVFSSIHLSFYHAFFLTFVVVFFSLDIFFPSFYSFYIFGFILLQGTHTLSLFIFFVVTIITTITTTLTIITVIFVIIINLPNVSNACTIFIIFLLFHNIWPSYFFLFYILYTVLYSFTYNHPT